jgi:hypothetical protein
MTTSEVNIFLSSRQRVVASGTIWRGSKTVQFFHVISDENALQTDMDHVGGDIQNVYGV